MTLRSRVVNLAELQRSQGREGEAEATLRMELEASRAIVVIVVVLGKLHALLAV